YFVDLSQGMRPLQGARFARELAPSSIYFVDLSQGMRPLQGARFARELAPSSIYFVDLSAFSSGFFFAVMSTSSMMPYSLPCADDMKLSRSVSCLIFSTG